MSTTSLTSSVSIVNFKHVIASWMGEKKRDLTL